MKNGVVFIIGLLGTMLIGCTASSKNLSAPVNKNISPTATSVAIAEPLSEFAPNIIVERTLTFSGEVKRGDIFEQKFGQDLLFCLLPDSLGWHVVISSELHGDCDWSSPSYSGLLNPPFWGTNPTFIQGWHFRNENNTDANDGSVNAPQEKRWFNFLFNEHDYQIGRAAIDCRLRNQCGNLDQEQAMQMIADIPKSRGIMNITHLELGNLIEGEQAWIEYMEFDVELLLPNDFGSE